MNADKRLKRVAKALAALQPEPPEVLTFMGTPPHRFDADLLRAVLVRCACPPVCIGHRQRPPAPDWHEWCERKADAALAIILNVQPPQRETS